ncbi:MAG: cell surface protein SprA [Bacteroidales bacterium]|nr:cell surface protein SprA [Bacteroidales bacterium]
MRMFMQGFQDSVILRFAKLELVRGEWRKYNLSLREGGQSYSVPEEKEGTFEISSVNIEENAQKSPVNYVLPPGIDRVIDPQNPQLTQLNEQSMVLKVNNLLNGDARAAYKTMDLDVRQYKRLQMEVHAEDIPGAGSSLKDDEITLFIRMGSDYRNNYYEIEVPLKLTRHKSNYSNNSDEDRRAVWPLENRIDFAFEDFQRVKQARNDLMRVPNTTITYSTIFDYQIDGTPYTYYICGNPNLSNVRTMMIGIRYPKNKGTHGSTRSAEVWVNELRLTNFNEKGGWAANARVITKLADLGTLSIAGSTLKPGFGSIDQKVNERSKEEINTYDISSNLELGKFFPEKSGVQIPMYIGYSESFTDPEYNPLDPDIPLQAALDNAANKAERDSIIRLSRDYVMRRSLNFTNVRINKMDGKPHFYDISNWSFNYAFNETYSHNIRTERSIDKRYHGGIMYNFTGRPKNNSTFPENQNI